MAGFVASGRAIDLVLAVIVLEFAWLSTRGGWRPGDAALRLLPGAFLLLAVRAGVTGADWRWPALFVALSLPAHLLDLGRTPRRG